MKIQKITIFSLIVFISISVGIIGLQVNANNEKIRSINSEDGMSNLFLQSLKNSDYETLKFFHCRAKGSMEQSDVNQFLERFIDQTKSKNLEELKIVRMDNRFNLMNLEGLDDMFISVEIQDPIITELKTKKSYCFYLNGNSSIFSK